MKRSRLKVQNTMPSATGAVGPAPSHAASRNAAPGPSAVTSKWSSPYSRKFMLVSGMAKSSVRVPASVLASPSSRSTPIERRFTRTMHGPDTVTDSDRRRILVLRRQCDSKKAPK